MTSIYHMHNVNPLSLIYYDMLQGLMAKLLNPQPPLIYFNDYFTSICILVRSCNE